MNNRILYPFIGVFLLLFLNLSTYAEVKISFISGGVSVKQRNNDWKEAKIGMVLSNSDRIKTLSNTKAVLVLNETTHIWVRENSEMEISNVGNESIFSLLAGKIKAKVRLLAGKKFNVKTPICVASVRGTEFAISSEGCLEVLEGRVLFMDLQFNQQVEVGEGQISSIDNSGGVIVPRDMTQDEKNKVLEEWQDFNNIEKNTRQEQIDKKQDQVKADLKKDINDLRNEIKQVVQNIKSDISVTRELTNEIKESDISAGRTLRDVHGNLVRVEQHMLRPDNKTLQLLNLTKRNNYNYSNRQGWGYRGKRDSRLDIVDVTIKMNMDLPEQITEWPGYMMKKGDDLHPEKVVVRITNQQDELRFNGDWRLKGEYDDKGKIMKEDGLIFQSYINGWLVDKNYEPKNDNNALYKEGIEGDGSKTDDLWAWAISPQIRLIKEDKVEFVRLFSEAYCINNDGKILNLKNLVSTSDNPFIVLKTLAAEQITFCRKLDDTDFFKNGNLDIVVTPDLVITIAGKIASQIGDLTNSGTDQ